MSQPAQTAVAQDPQLDALGAAPPGKKQFVLKQGDMFLVADIYGDVDGDTDGLFRNDTRVLSTFRLLLGGHRASLLGGNVAQDNVFFTAHLTNHPLAPIGGQSTPEGVIHVARTRFLGDYRLYEMLILTNFSERKAELPFSYIFGADFRDMFEVRGKQRAARGKMVAPKTSEHGVVLGYEGLDGMARWTAIAFSPAPRRIAANRAEYLVALDPGGRFELHVEVGPEFAG